MDGLVAGALIAQRYRLSAPLGSGAQGSVWEAVDTRRGGAVCAIKFARGGVRQRGEVEILLAIEHPSLPRATDYGTHGDGTFIVLERIAGTPLSRPHDARTVVRALCDVAQALAVLHDAGIVHGDVKPANILVGDGRAWLVDLGLASQSSDVAGDARGTLAFMAPEALAGERGPGTDLYALGVTATMALTGQHPLLDDPTQRTALLAALARQAPPRDRVVAALPPSCRDAITQLLSADPERRPTSARALLGRLARDAAGELLASQRNAALSIGANGSGRVALTGRDAERAAAHAALEAALTAHDGKVGVVLTGPEGAGRRRLADDAIRATRIAWAARGELPDVVDELPAEPTRATIVRRIDARPEDIDSLARSIARVARYADGGPPIALVATTSESDAPSLVHVPVGPLDAAALRSLLEALAGRAPSDATLAAWRDATEGLAGYTVSLAQALDTATIASATAEDLSRAEAPAPELALRADLGHDAREALLALAAAGEPLSPQEIASIAGLASSAAAVAEIVRRGMALEREGRIRLLAPVSLTTLSQAERARLGTAIEACLAAQQPARTGARARAALLRDDRAAARAHAEAAARAPGATPGARVEWLSLARSLADDPDGPLALRLAQELVTLGEPRRALSVLAALPDAPEVLAQRADALRRAGSIDEARALAVQLDGHADAGARAVGRIVLARDALDRGDVAGASNALGALADGDGAPDALRARALEAGALCALAAGDAATAITRIERAEHLAQRAGDRVQRARLRSLSGIACQHRGAHEAGLRAYRDAWSLAIEAGDAHGAATYAVNLGAAELECGALGEAFHWMARGARSLARLGRMTELGRALGNLASLHAFVGDRAGALEASSRAERAAVDACDGVTEALARMIAAEVSLDGSAAGEALVAAAEASMRGGNEALAADASARAAVAFARVGEVARARTALGRADGAPRPLRAIAALELSLSGPAAPVDVARALAEARRAVADEPTLEHELSVLSLAVRVAEAQSPHDADEARRSRASHAARVEALAATLPESFAALFRDAHALSAISGPSSQQASSAFVASAAERRWRRLAEITRELNSEHRLRPLLERLMDAVVELTGAARGFILLKGPDGALRVRTARNIGQRDLAGDEMALSRSVAERVAQSGEALVTVDATSDRRLDAFESVHAMRLRSILCVPLSVQGERVGTVYVDDRFRTGAFAEEAMDVAREFAEFAAVAIHNARQGALLRRALRRSERLTRELSRRVDEQTVELEATRLALAPATRGRYDAIIGRGPVMLRTLSLLDKVAPTSMPVLLLGESGTGKELLARALHANSPRGSRAFVAENCGAIPETLLESVLFGHVKGAFTGADRTRAGLFEVADGGTLFLDEIGEMSPTMQAKLLRVLQDGEVRPLGGERSRHVDVRVIAATHRDLGEMVRQGRFREDLYYRLAVMVVPVPALRQRREDLPGLVAHFVEKHAHRQVAVERKAMARLVAYAWPGNVRQLENEIMRACVLAEGAVREDDLSPALMASPDAGAPGARAAAALAEGGLDLRRAVGEVERQLIERALREFAGNQSRAARALGLSRFGLQKKLKRLAAGREAAGADDDERDDDPADSEERITGALRADTT